MVEFDSTVLKISDYPPSGKVGTRVAEVSAPASFDYKPGQFCMISHAEVKLLNDSTKLRWASFSISSSPEQKGIVELCVANHGTETGLTFRLCEKTKIGDSFKIRGPFGNFVLKEESLQKELYFVTLGTGIAPIMAMLRTLHAKKHQGKVKLFFGFRDKTLFLYENEIRAWMKEWKNFEANLITSREDWDGKRGHVQDLLKNYAFPEDKSNIHLYLCGAPVAVDELIALLKEKGYSDEQLFKEKW